MRKLCLSIAVHLATLKCEAPIPKLNLTSQVCLDLGKIAEAVTMASTALQLQRARLSSDHPDVLQTEETLRQIAALDNPTGRCGGSGGSEGSAINEGESEAALAAAKPKAVKESETVNGSEVVKGSTPIRKPKVVPELEVLKGSEIVKESEAAKEAEVKKGGAATEVESAAEWK